MNFEINLETLFNSEKNNSCLILGPSPSMMNFPFDNFKGKIICIGDSILRGKSYFKADYWIASNNEWPVPNYKPHLDILNSFTDLIFIFSDTALYNDLWTKSQDYLDKNLNIKWSCFDERHFNKKSCSPKLKCCDLIKKMSKTLTIQEYFIKQFHDKYYKATIGGTVAEYALILAALLGFKKIYIQGIDIPRLAKDYNYFEDEEVDKIILDTKKYISEEIKKKRYSERLFFKSIYDSLINKIKYNKPIRLDSDKNIFSQMINKFFLKINNKSIFSNDYELIINNLNNISKTLSNFNIEVVNLNENSNLVKCKYIKNHTYSINQIIT